jgi:hypothetical protein
MPIEELLEQNEEILEAIKNISDNLEEYKKEKFAGQEKIVNVLFLLVEHQKKYWNY